MILEIDAEEKEILYIAVMLRLGFIETGTISRAKNLENIGRPTKKVLTSEQMRLILKSEDLLNKILNTK